MKTIEGVTSVVEQNSAAAQQTAANSTQVTEAIDAITTVIEQSVSSIQEMSASLEELSAQVDQGVAATQSLDPIFAEPQEKLSRPSPATAMEVGPTRRPSLPRNYQTNYLVERLQP